MHSTSPTRVLARLLAAALVSLGGAASAQQVTTPREHLGRPVGVDFELADWDEVSSYYRLIAAQSPRVSLETVGRTTEGRDFLVATVASEANQARLAEIRAMSARVADPRGLSAAEREDLLERAVPILMVSLQMHSTEAAGSQFGLELVHRLATSDEEPWRSARERLVVVILPCTNPDGLEHVVRWYREHVDTPYEGAGLLELYQHYAGHDNNRDWFMLSLQETRLVTQQLYEVWRPHVYWDVHQQGQSTERIFVPPFRDPLNPNLDPGVIAGINALGTRAVLDLTREGFTGVSTGVSYDMWWNGGNRNVPVRHNIIGILTEAASVNLGSPVFLPVSRLRSPVGASEYGSSNQFVAPWPGGWWRLRDIIDYELAIARSMLGSLTREPRTWVANKLEATERAIAAAETDVPIAWVIPSDNRDPGAVRRLVDVLVRTGVEVEVATEAVVADGRSWPAGSVVVRRAQPYGQHVKDLFEIQRYPDGAAPYDVAGWSLPYLLGVHRVEVVGELSGATRAANDAADATAAFAGRTRASATSGVRWLDASASDTWPVLFEALAGGGAAALTTLGEVRDWVGLGAEKSSFGALPVEAEKAELVVAERLPRVGLYAPWSGSMDEGWMRFAFDSSRLPYVTVRNEQLRAGRLEDFLDVLVIASEGSRSLDQGRSAGSLPGRWAGGLDPEGAAAVESFARGGGTVVAVGSSGQWIVDLCGLGVTDAVRGPGAGDFSCPGSVLRAIPAESVFTAGLPDSLAVFFSRSSAWRVDEDEAHADGPARKPEVLLRYAPSRTLLSGWIRGAEAIAGQGAWVRVPYGAGAVHLFGFRPQYRGWSQGTWGLLYRAIVFDGGR